ncbi:hypothetical protein C8R43DRAFT_954792 [Mycena crocata]|nr:hypothetical protein C8R43DRAFT_954792 [Mycena crocata]
MNCWYLVYQFPVQGIAPAPSKDVVPTQPLYLRILLSADFRPPLGVRLTLACALASSFSGFYGSKWLHKDVRSDNIVFPGSASAGTYDIVHPIVVVFTELSRPSVEPTPQNSVNPTPNFNTNNPGYAIYQHPWYLGPIQHIPYMLLEIARWMPLEKFLDAIQTGQQLSGGWSLQTMTKERDKDLAFSMGTP